MNDKKAVVEVQFNWILILIIGGLILVFFATVIVKMKASSDERAHLSILKSMRSIIVGSQSSAGTTSVLTLPKASMEFGCDALRVGSQGNQFQDMLVFAPRSLQAEQLVVKTLSWDIPFRVTNVVYISSPLIQYVFIGSDPLRDEIRDMMPDELDVQTFTSHSETAFASVDRTLPTRLVYFGNTPSGVAATLQSFTSRESSAVFIDTSGISYDVTFFEKFQSSSTTQVTIEREFILGAVYTTQESLYTCVLQNAIEKARNVALVYKDRAAAIRSDPDTDAACHVLLQDAENQFSDLRALFTEFPGGRWSTGNFINDYRPITSTLESKNEQLSLQSCPYAY